MPYELSWFVEDRVIALDVRGFFSMTEVYEASESIFLYVQAGTAPVHLLIDVTRMEGFESNLRGLRNATLTYMNHESFGWAVAYGTRGDPIVPLVAESIIRLTGARIRLFETRDEALAFLAGQDDTLDNLPGP